MAFYTDSITLLKRADGSNTNPSRTPSTEIPNGDLKPWRIRLQMVHHGVSEVNKGSIILRMDENKTFINTGPILTDEEAKNKYIIEAKISQTIGGSTNTGKTFQFQIKSCSIDVDQNQGSTITLELVEIQIRMKEAFTGARHMYYTPEKEFTSRLLEFNNYQGTNNSINSPSVSVLYSACSADDISTCNGQSKIALPKTDNLKQHYTPAGLETYHDLLIDVISKLSNESSVGGVFTDFYFDFETTSATNTMLVIAEEYGSQDTGITLDPKAIDTIDATETQQASINHVNFKNHVILKGNSSSGSLPTEFMRYVSELEHAKIRPEWSSSNSYVVGQQVKTITTVTGVSAKVVRFFECIQTRSATSTKPDQDHTYWKEDFNNIPKYDKYGRYSEDDIVYFNPSNEIRYYRAKRRISRISLRALRKTSPLNVNSYDPDTQPNDWEDLSSSGAQQIVPSRSTTNFTEWIHPSPWTDDLIAWEKNLAGLGGGLPEASGNYVGFAQDWNITRQTHGHGDYTNYHKQITAKMVSKMGINNPASDLDTSHRERYDGQRVIVGTNPQGVFSGYANRIAEWVQNPNDGSASWFFSDAPQTNDTITNMDNGKLYKWSGSAWEVAWEIQDDFGENKPAPFHLVYDLYKVHSPDGLPNGGIEYRYAWDKNNGSGKTYGINNRGAWLNFWFPFPRYDVSSSQRLGFLYGGNGSSGADGSDTKNCYLSTFNMTTDRTGDTIGWNNGTKSEDMGKINAIQFYCKVGFWNAGISNNYMDANHSDAWNGYFEDLSMSADTTKKVTGDSMGQIPMLFWAVDKFDRIWFSEFKLRRNDEWDLVTVPFGHMSGGGTKNLYFGKWNRLPEILGYKLTFLDFTLKEMEHTGAKFDWVYVKGFGIMTKMGYNTDLGLYTGGTTAFMDQLGQTVAQIGNEVYNFGLDTASIFTFFKDIAFGDGTSNSGIELHNGNSLINWTTIAMAGLHLKKELFVVSDNPDGTGNPIAGARTSIVHRSDEFDYVNAKISANAKRARSSFYPQQWIMRTIGDVRMKFGQSFKVKGDRVPNKETGQDFIRMVCKSVTHTIDHTGYHMDIVGQKKFTTRGDDNIWQ